MISALFAVFLGLCASVQAQQGEFIISRFSGLNDTDAPATIEDSQAQDALNVEANLGGSAILKRKGIATIAALTITTSPITGSHTFYDTNGNRVRILCQDTYCYKSTNDGSYTVFLTTATRPDRWSWVSVNNKAYGANSARDIIARFDGTNLIYSTGIPRGSILELSNDRLIVSDTAANPNRTSLSASGSFEDFNGGVDPEDSYTTDFGSPGDRITATKFDRGRLYIGKRDTITICLLADQYTTNCSIFSRNIGTLDNESFVATGDGLYFKGQDGNFWLINQDGIANQSKKIQNLVKSQVSGSIRTNTQTTQSDWQAGVQFSTASQTRTNLWNTASIPGSIFQSSITFVDTSSSDFAGGAIAGLSLTDSIGSLVLSSVTVQDNWSNSVVAGHLNWTNTQGGISISNSYVLGTDPTTDLYSRINTSSITISSGSYSWRHFHSNGGAPRNDCSINTAENSECYEARFMKNGGNNYYAAYLAVQSYGGNPHYVGIRKNVGGVDTKLTQSVLNYPGGSVKSWRVDRTSAGVMVLSIDGVFIGSTTADVAISSSVRFEFAFSGDSGATPNSNQVTSLYTYQYASSGTITSRAFDTAFSTPVFGVLNSTYTLGTSTSEGSISFWTQSSADGVSWDARVVSSDAAKINSLGKRYVRYQAQLNTFVSTKTPSISDVSLLAAATGQFVTKCIELSNTITAFGNLSCAETLSGTGSLVYYATSAVSCALLPTTAPTSWQKVVTNNATLPITVSSAVYVGFRSLLGSATDQAQVDACTIYWNDGIPAPPTWGTYDSIRNAAYWSIAIGTFTYNNRVLKYDLNLREWFPFSLNASVHRLYENQLYFGSSNSSKWYLYGQADNDDGNAINAYWKSKDFVGSHPFQEKNFQRISTIARNQQIGAVSVTYGLSNLYSQTYSINTSTSSGNAYIRNNYNMPLASPQTFINIKFSNSEESQPFEVLGAKIEYFAQPWRSLSQ